MIVVTDTSVVLNLCLLGQEGLLRSIFASVVAPPMVASEFQRLASADPRFSGAVWPSFIAIEVPAGLHAALSGNRRLHQGELEALSLASELRADAVLIDELAGRAAAVGMGLRCVGILGILIQAKVSGLLPAIRPLIDDLQVRGRFWISPQLRQQVLRRVGE